MFRLHLGNPRDPHTVTALDDSTAFYQQIGSPWVERCIEIGTPQQRLTIPSPAISFLPTAEGMITKPISLTESSLFTLPLKLRDIIYDHLLSAGEVSIMRTCKKVHAETRDSIYKRGVLHIEFAPTAPETRLMVPSRIRHKIQNVQIRLHLENVSDIPPISNTPCE